METDDYANSMFRFEHLHDAWIGACAEYVRYVFSDRIRDKVVLDYAFGRGNWSLAFLRAGASHVIAVDASESNVRRFRDYCTAQGIDRVDVRLGNFVESRDAITADIIWVYGILHHIPETDRFVAALRASARDEESLFLFYVYDEGSLRQSIVEKCRKAFQYRDEGAFLSDSLVLTPRARLRARDDLAAFYLSWWCAADLQELLRRHGLFVEAQPRSFDQFNGRPESQEFQPHHFVCSQSDAHEITATDPARRCATDASLIGQLIEILWSEMEDPDQRRRAVLGIMNTHFSALAASGGETSAITDVFLFLFNALVRRGANPDGWPARMRALFALGNAALENAPRVAEDYSELAAEDSSLVRYLLANSIRI